MTTDINQFNADVDRAVQEKIIGAFVNFHRRVALDAWQMAQGDSRHGGASPVWTGRFMRSHTINIGAVLVDEEPPHPETTPMKGGGDGLRWPDEPDVPYRSRGISFASNLLKQLKPFENVFIANSLPYAKDLELGHSKMRAPLGVYRVIMEVLEHKYANVKASDFVRR